MKKRMELQQYIFLLEEQQLIKEAFWEKGALSQKVEYISYDSQDIKEGMLFVCKGAHFLPKYLAHPAERGQRNRRQQQHVHGDRDDPPGVIPPFEERAIPPDIQNMMDDQHDRHADPNPFMQRLARHLIRHQAKQQNGQYCVNNFPDDLVLFHRFSESFLKLSTEDGEEAGIAVVIDSFDIL